MRVVLLLKNGMLVTLGFFHVERVQALCKLLIQCQAFALYASKRVDLFIETTMLHTGCLSLSLLKKTFMVTRGCSFCVTIQNGFDLTRLMSLMQKESSYEALTVKMSWSLNMGSGCCERWHCTAKSRGLAANILVFWDQAFLKERFL